ncbi:MAG: hypothetical protein RLZ22_135 [Verrucomicrobiota bacterium]|jgi:hypothetical protein
MKTGTFIQRVIVFATLTFGVMRKGLIPLAASLFFTTACDKFINKKPSEPEASSAESTQEQIDLERIQKGKEEQEQKAKEQELAERERLERERLEREKEMEKRKAEAKMEELRARREKVRQQAVGQQIVKLETLKGDVYDNVIIREVSPVGISIRHDAGSRRVPFEQLPLEMQRQFLFDPEEKEKALAQEHAAQSAHVEQEKVAQEEKTVVQKTVQTDEYRVKVTKAIATKSARIEVLEDEIRSLEGDVAAEESKKYYNRGYYRNDGRWIRNAGGVSRAPILREQVNEKRSELGVLKQQVAALRVELDSLR